MFKKIFGFILIFAFISVLCGQDLKSQISRTEEKYDINIGNSVKTTINNILGCDVFDMISDIFQNVEIVEDK